MHTSTFARDRLEPVHHSLGLLAAALLAGFFAQGCSLEFVPPALDEATLEVPLPLLEIAAPYGGLRYTLADDRRADEPGVQLPVRVRVRDVENGIALEDLEILCAESDMRERVSVEEDELGHRFASLPAATFHATKSGARFTLIARAGADLPEASVGFVVVGHNDEPSARE